MRILISGILHDEPVARTTAKGSPFITAKLRSDSTTPATWASIAVFDESLIQTMGRLHKGAALAVSGNATVDLYTPQSGTPRVNISVTADQIATLRKMGNGGKQ